jgi:DNA-binding NarL/FixJ family response regulator
VAINPSTAAAVLSSTISAVVIEEDVPILEILGSWLKDAEGFSCVGQFHDPQTAFTEILRRKPDVALVDINLPDLGGIECIRKLKPLLPATQFITLTLYEDSNRIFEALVAGATGYLLKRTPRAALISALRDVHAGGSPMTSNIARKVAQSLKQSQPPRASQAALSKREDEVLTLLAQGYLGQEIADLLGIDMPTVSLSIRRVYEKLHAPSRSV